MESSNQTMNERLRSYAAPMTSLSTVILFISSSIMELI
jgi:hypothetical protein